MDYYKDESPCLFKSLVPLFPEMQAIPRYSKRVPDGLVVVSIKLRFLFQFRVESLVDKLMENEKYHWPDLVSDLDQFKFGFDSDNVGKFLGSNAQKDKLPRELYNQDKMVKIKAGYWVLYGVNFDNKWHQLSYETPKVIEPESLKRALFQLVRLHFVEQSSFKPFNPFEYKESMKRSLSNPIDVVDDFQIDPSHAEMNRIELQDINDRINFNKVRFGRSGKIGRYRNELGQYSKEGVRPFIYDRSTEEYVAEIDYHAMMPSILLKVMRDSMEEGWSEVISKKNKSNKALALVTNVAKAFEGLLEYSDSNHLNSVFIDHQLNEFMNKHKLIIKEVIKASSAMKKSPVNALNNRLGMHTQALKDDYYLYLKRVLGLDFDRNIIKNCFYRLIYGNAYEDGIKESVFVSRDVDDEIGEEESSPDQMQIFLQKFLENDPVFLFAVLVIQNQWNSVHKILSRKNKRVKNVAFCYHLFHREVEVIKRVAGYIKHNTNKGSENSKVRKDFVELDIPNWHGDLISFITIYDAVLISRSRASDVKKIMDCIVSNLGYHNYASIEYFQESEELTPPKYVNKELIALIKKNPKLVSRIVGAYRNRKSSLSFKDKDFRLPKGKPIRITIELMISKILFR